MDECKPLPRATAPGTSARGTQTVARGAAAQRCSASGAGTPSPAARARTFDAVERRLINIKTIMLPLGQRPPPPKNAPVHSSARAARTAPPYSSDPTRSHPLLPPGHPPGRRLALTRQVWPSRDVAAQVKFESKLLKRFIMFQLQARTSRRFQRRFHRFNVHRLTPRARTRTPRAPGQ